jgi:hypothetical protein
MNLRIAILALTVPPLACLAGAPAVQAAGPIKVDQAPAVQAVLDCRKVADNTQRLACFDAATARMDDAQAKGDLVTIDKVQRQTLRKEAFGFSLPSLAIFDKGAPKEEATTLALKVLSASRDGAGRWRFTLEGDQFWVQTDSDSMTFDPKAGSKVVIKKGALGSYHMNVDGQPSILVRRER